MRPPVKITLMAFEILLAAMLLIGAAASPARAANPSMADDFSRMMDWLTKGVADGLGFNAGSSFSPPTEVRPWRLQPDVSLGVGFLPFDKKSFPRMQVQALAEKHPEEALPSQMMFPNLTIHMRMGLPGRTDVGARFANMTTPSGYRLSPTTTGDGQSNTLGIAIRRHFWGGDRPLLSASAIYNHTFGFFNFTNEYKHVELTNGFFADSTNFGTLEWDVRSFGLNLTASQTYGKYLPFAGFGYNHVIGSVTGKLEAQWKTPLIAPSVGRASNTPFAENGRFIAGFQRDGSLFKFFMNGELKAMGPMAGKSFVISTGLAAPFKIGARSALVRHGRNQPSNLASSAPERPRELDPVPPPKAAKRRATAMPDARTVPQSRKDRYWIWDRTEPEPKKTAREAQPELIFIR